jgi:uncharacterized membrane protein YeaQ/YmgE (transglycosylase-associated protein family)
MSKNYFVLIGIIIVIAIISAIITYFRTSSFSTSEEIAAKGFAAIRRDRVSFYGVFMPILVGIISYFVYRFIYARWPDSAEMVFLFLAIGIAVLFTVLAAVVFKMRGFVELTVLHILYAAGFGWVMPKLLTM